MMERFFCMDCKIVGELNVHGYCGTCNSTAVVSTNAPRNVVKMIFQEHVNSRVERILTLSGCK